MAPHLEPPHPSQGLGYGGPGSTAEVGGRVASMVSAGLRASVDSLQSRRPMPQPNPGFSQDRTFARWSWQPVPASRSRSRPASHADDSGESAEYSSPLVNPPTAVPPWQEDALDFETGPACPSWMCSADNRPCPWLPRTLLGSDLEKKVHNPAACDAIGYSMQPPSLFCTFVLRFSAFLMACCFISLFHNDLEATLGLSCRTRLVMPPVKETLERHEDGEESSIAKIWAEALVTTGACFLLAQGSYGLRAARERMERVRQTAVTLAYSFTKSTALNSETGHNREEMQLLVYECLALITAYPVALLEQLRGNTCEPAITKYCQSVARALKQLRCGQDVNMAPQPYETKPIPRRNRGGPQFATVEYFFEIFSLHLQLEYKQQKMRTKAPSLAPQHIIFNLRNHFENLVDVRNVDDRRTPIMRENIDMLSLAGRELAIFAYADIVPRVFLHSVSAAAWLIALYSPVQRCESIVDWRPGVSAAVKPPSLRTVATMAMISITSSLLTTLITEMRRMWDPFGRGMNTYGWSLGIAMEIDNMLNDFYEYDSEALIRSHVYMDPVPCRHEVSSEGDTSTGEGAQTV